MRRAWLPILSLGILLSTASAAHAQLDQKYEIKHPRGGFVLIDVATHNPVENPPVLRLAPEGSIFIIIEHEDANHRRIVRFTKVPSLTPAQTTRTIQTLNVLRDPTLSPNSALAPVVETGQTKLYAIDDGFLPRDYYQFYSGQDIGSLAVPFKIYKDGGLTAGGTIGFYYGYHYKLITVLGTAGLAVVPTAGPVVPGASGATSTVDAKTGVSAAGGLVFEPLPFFQIGVLTGVDHVGDPNYRYENKWWFSFGVGTTFIKR